jgi:hypothetical protein
MTVRITVVALAALSFAGPVTGQTAAVYTNVIDGRAYRQSIVRVERPAQPAAPVPSSIQTTPVLPRNYRAPLGASSYVPPTRSNWGETRVSRPMKTEQPWFVNGFYVGPSPSGNWTSTSIGRPIIDVNIVSAKGPAPRR